MGWDEMIFSFSVLCYDKTHNVNVHISALNAHREKKLLVSSEDYGRDLTGVQNLRKKHKRLEAELGAHEPAIQVGGSSVHPVFLQTDVCSCLVNL